MVDHLHSTCWKIKERRRSHTAAVNARRNALRKQERRRQQAVAEAAVAGTETVPALASQPQTSSRERSPLPPIKRRRIVQRPWTEQCEKTKAQLIGFTHQRRSVSTPRRNECTGGCASLGSPSADTANRYRRTAREIQSQTESWYRNPPRDTVVGAGQPAQVQSYKRGHQIDRYL